MNEHVGGAVVGGDETIALVRVEPLHGSLSHLPSPSRTSRESAHLARISCWPLTARESHKQSETPTVKTAGAFTIADFDNNSNINTLAAGLFPRRLATGRSPHEPVRTAALGCHWVMLTSMTDITTAIRAAAPGPHPSSQINTADT